MTAYRDAKKYLWVLSPLYILVPLLSVYIARQTGQSLYYWLPVAIFHLFFPMLDHLVGVDRHNPPEESVPYLQGVFYYKFLSLLAVPIHMIVMGALLYYVAVTPLSWIDYLAITLGCGLANGLGINTGHELGHKKSSLERWFAKIALSLSGYGHFYIEHNKGHHYHVATPEDFASSRYNESLYAFIGREWIGCFKRAWDLETARMRKRGYSVFSLRNEVVQTSLMTVILYTGLTIWLGLYILPMLILQAAYAWFLLSLANYTEHYGLLRQKKTNGKYEACQPRHSWNSNFLLSNLVLFQLQRHSDHHANPARRYQVLRDFDDVPTMPSGYPFMFTLALFPPLWKRVMNPKVLAWVGGDTSKVNNG